MPKEQFPALVATVAITHAAAAVTQTRPTTGQRKADAIGSEKAGTRRHDPLLTNSGKAPKATGQLHRNYPGSSDLYPTRQALYKSRSTAHNEAHTPTSSTAWWTVPDYPQLPHGRLPPRPRRRSIRGKLLENTVQNGHQLQALQNELKREGCFGGIPFPIPQRSTR